MRRVHIEIPDKNGRVYCRWRDKRVKFTPEHMDKYCFGDCRYLSGSVQGEGVECSYDETKPPRKG